MPEAVMSTFTLDFETVAKLADLSARTGKNKSELVRQAVALLYTQNEPVAEDAKSKAIAEAVAAAADRRQ